MAAPGTPPTSGRPDDRHGTQARDRADEEVEPLLPALRGRADLDRHLRDNLRVLRDTCTDESLRRRFDDVLAGRARLRDLARDGSYQRFMDPLVTEGARRWEEAGRPGMPEGSADPVEDDPPRPEPGGTW